MDGRYSDYEETIKWKEGDVISLAIVGDRLIYAINGEKMRFEFKLDPNVTYYPCCCLHSNYLNESTLISKLGEGTTIKSHKIKYFKKICEQI